MRIVLDTNVLISGIIWKGNPRTIVGQWLEGDITLLSSEDILAEYREVLRRFEHERGLPIFTKWNLLLTEFSEMVAPRRLGGICRDPKDEMYLEAAVGGRAKAIVSGDKDLLTLGSIQNIPILTPRAFLNLY